MKKEFWVVDTCPSIGVSPTVHFIAEEELELYLEKNEIDIQIAFQPDESFHHQTPEWNPFLGNDYVAKIQRMFPQRVIGLATIQAWHQANQYPVSLVTRNIALEEMDRCVIELGLKGLRMNPVQHNYQFNNRRVVWPLLDRLSLLQAKCGRKLLISVHANGDSLNNSPEAIAETAHQFPELTFLMQHAGFVWAYGTVSNVAAPLQNVLLHLSTMPQKGIVFDAFAIWDSFVQPIVILGTLRWPTLFVELLRYIQDRYFQQWSMTFAACLISILPISLLYFVLQNRIISGLTSGAVKS